jgi:phosphatidate cytidylyltransferase
MTPAPTVETAPTRKQPSNLTQRIITTVVFAPVVLFLVLQGGWWFAIGVAIAAVIAALEFYLLAENRPEQGSALIGTPMVLSLVLIYQGGRPELWPFVLIAGSLLTIIIEFIRHPHTPRRNFRQLLMTLFGVFYIGFPAAFLVAIRNFEGDGLIWLAVVLALTWGTDIMAYVGGRLWGKHKLAPRISPKKTVEGAVIGYLGGALSSLAILAYAGEISPASFVLIAVGPIVAILGDLFESALKRAFQVKDSHIAGFNVLPGHGGVLDRIDALIWVTVLVYFFVLAFNLSGPVAT